MTHITLPGSIRSKKNSKQPLAIPSPGKSTLFKRYKHAGLKPVRIIMIPSDAYKQWEDQARADVLKQFMLPPYEALLRVKATIYYKGQRPDLSGCLESVGDCLEGIVWANDKQIESWDGSRRIKDNANPRTEIEVTVFEAGKENA